MLITVHCWSKGASTLYRHQGNLPENWGGKWENQLGIAISRPSFVASVLQIGSTTDAPILCRYLKNGSKKLMTGKNFQFFRNISENTPLENCEFWPHEVTVIVRISRKMKPTKSGQYFLNSQWNYLSSAIFLSKKLWVVRPFKDWWVFEHSENSNFRCL